MEDSICHYNLTLFSNPLTPKSVINRGGYTPQGEEMQIEMKQSLQTQILVSRFHCLNNCICCP